MQAFLLFSAIFLALLLYHFCLFLSILRGFFVIEETLNISKEDIIENIELTPEEMSAILEGADISVRLESADITETVSEEDKQAVEKAVSSDTYIALYLALDMYKIIDTHNGEPTTTELHQLNGNVTVKIKIPEKFINLNTAINR